MGTVVCYDFLTQYEEAQSRRLRLSMLNRDMVFPLAYPLQLRILTLA